MCDGAVNLTDTRWEFSRFFFLALRGSMVRKLLAVTARNSSQFHKEKPGREFSGAVKAVSSRLVQDLDRSGWSVGDQVTIRRR